MTNHFLKMLVNNVTNLHKLFKDNLCSTLEAAHSGTGQRTEVLCFLLGAFLSLWERSELANTLNMHNIPG